MDSRDKETTGGVCPPWPMGRGFALKSRGTSNMHKTIRHWRCQSARINDDRPIMGARPTRSAVWWSAGEPTIFGTPPPAQKPGDCAGSLGGRVGRTGTGREPGRLVQHDHDGRAAAEMTGQLSSYALKEEHSNAERKQHGIEIPFQYRTVVDLCRKSACDEIFGFKVQGDVA